MRNMSKKLRKEYKKLDKMAVDELIRIALKILKEHSCYDEFIISMGSCFFTTKKDHKIIDLVLYDTDKPTFQYFCPLIDFLNEWNDIFKLTGLGIRFRADGKIMY